MDEILTNQVAYLAAPYTKRKSDGTIDLEAMRLREKQIAQTAANLMESGYIVYSPVSHGSAIARHLPDSSPDWSNWAKQCIGMLEKCDVLLVLKLPGWAESVGLAAELKHATKLGMKIHYLEYQY